MTVIYVALSLIFFVFIYILGAIRMTTPNFDALNAGVDALTQTVKNLQTDVNNAVADLKAVIGTTGSQIADAKLAPIVQNLQNAIATMGQIDAAAKAADPGTAPASASGAATASGTTTAG